jgi:protein-S-isoprenylcysteine O-methyltransferase Ste14
MSTPAPQLSLTTFVLTVVWILLFPALLLLLGGNPRWAQGWVISIWFLALCFSTIAYLYIRDPGLLAERYRQPGSGQQVSWDRYVVVGLVVGFIVWILVMPLDAERFGWSPTFPVWPQGLGLLSLLGSAILFVRSYADNSFVSPLVRVQDERDQRVVSTGVYGFVRHPMYLGGILLFLGAPLLLGSVWGLAIGLGLSLLLVARIAGEERLLESELEGYAEYKARVRYRLVPHVW